jgi:gas vesicle protein
MISAKGTHPMFERKSTFKSYLFTFAGGLISGAILGLLFAPITGKKMQKKVSGVTNQVIDKVDELQQTVRKFANA